MGDWLSQEVANCKFADIRLGKRFSKLMELLFEGIGQTIPLVGRDWAAGTKAAYRFLDNDWVTEAEILAGQHGSLARYRKVDRHTSRFLSGPRRG